jgi:hypothetical protein
MSDDKHKQDNRDRSRVSGSEEYEVAYFAEKHGLTLQQGRELIAQHGNQRDVLDKAAEELKRA